MRRWAANRTFDWESGRTAAIVVDGWGAVLPPSCPKQMEAGASDRVLYDWHVAGVRRNPPVIGIH